MRILVTGAAGFVGQRLCRLLAASGHETLALVHPDALERARATTAGSALVPADLATLRPADLPARVDAVVALAQARRFRDFPATAGETFAVNVQANLTLLQWALGAGAERFVHVSSGGIYGGGPAPLVETDRLGTDKSLGFYLGTKLCAEVVFQNYAPLFKGAVTLRPFFIYGPDQRKDMFVARLVESVRTGVPVQIQGPDGLRMNPLFVDDAASAISRALGLEGAHVCNLAGPDVLTLRALCERIGRALGREPVFEAKAGSPVDYIADIARMRATLDVEPTPIAQGIARTVGA